MPEADARWFPSPSEDGVAVFVVHKHLMLVHDGCAICVAEFSQTKQIVGKAQHDVSGLDVEGWD